MKLVEQLLSALGGDCSRSITVIPSFGCYICSAERLEEFSAERMCVSAKGRTVTVEGENLEVGEYFERDMFIRGKVKAVKID